MPNEVSFELCSEVEQIAKELVEKVEDFRDIDPEDILGLKMSKDKSTVLARVMRIPKYIYPALKNTDKRLIIWVWASHWDDVNTTDEKKKRIINHELSHIEVSPKTGGYKLRKHDVEDWTEPLKESGLNVEKYKSTY